MARRRVNSAKRKKKAPVEAKIAQGAEHHSAQKTSKDLDPFRVQPATTAEWELSEYLGWLWEAPLEDRNVRDEIARLLGIVLGKLTNAAGAGHDEAIALLLDALLDSVARLNQISPWNVKAYQRVAAPRNLWPVVVHPHKDSLADTKALLDFIGLGAKTGIGYRNARAFRWRDERAIAAGLYLELRTWRNFPERHAGYPEKSWHRLASNLPPLKRDKAVIKAWWKPVMLLFEERYGPAFEALEDFERRWLSPGLVPKRMGGDPDKLIKMSTARKIYSEVTGWWLHGVKRPGNDAAIQTEHYTNMPRGSWQLSATRLPKLSQREAVITQWYEVCKLCYLEAWPEVFSEKDFAPYMKNVLRRRNQVRKTIKDLLEQGLSTVAAQT